MLKCQIFADWSFAKVKSCCFSQFYIIAHWICFGLRLFKTFLLFSVTLLSTWFIEKDNRHINPQWKLFLVATEQMAQKEQMHDSAPPLSTSKIPPSHLPPVIYMMCCCQMTEAPMICGETGERRGWPKNEGEREMAQLQADNRCWEIFLWSISTHKSSFSHSYPVCALLRLSNTITLLLHLFLPCDLSQLARWKEGRDIKRTWVYKCVRVCVTDTHKNTHGEILTQPAICYLNIFWTSILKDKEIHCTHTCRHTTTLCETKNTVKHNPIYSLV